MSRPRQSRRAFLGSTAAAALFAVAGGLTRPAFAQSATDTLPGNQMSYAFGPADWMRIPSIGVDSHIADVGVVDGYYDVPWFDIGHHADSHNPGDVGNSIYNGHVVTINAGEVFRNLDQVQQGDAIYVYTPAYRLDWVATDMTSVDQSDDSFLDDTREPRLTLYTCTGEFNPIERSYAQRLVVSAQLVNIGPRG
jgi:LPXTG-site transpeptidase (sortase) family protein